MGNFVHPLPTDYLTIRLSAEESKALTRIRGSYEFRGEVPGLLLRKPRWTIRELIEKIILEKGALRMAGEFFLPEESSLPVIYKEVDSEQISLKKSPGESAALKVLIRTKTNSETQYGQADIVRKLIEIVDGEQRALMNSFLAKQDK